MIRGIRVVGGGRIASMSHVYLNTDRAELNWWGEAARAYAASGPPETRPVPPVAGRKPMPVADLCIEFDNEAALPIYVERKLLADLSASIVDGRYDEQKARLIALRDAGARVVILLVGQPALHSREATAVATSTLRDGIPVLVCANDALAMKMLVEMARAGGDPPKASGVLLAERRKSDDPAFVWRQQLQCFHGISKSKAEALAHAWPAPRALLDVHAEDIAAITYEAAAGGEMARRIGPVAGRKIAAFFGNPTAPRKVSRTKKAKAAV